MRGEEEGGEEEEQQEEREVDDHARVVFLRIGYDSTTPTMRIIRPSSSSLRSAGSRARARAAAAARARACARPARWRRRDGVARVGPRPGDDARGPGRMVPAMMSSIGPASRLPAGLRAHGAGNRSATAGPRGRRPARAQHAHDGVFAERIGERARARAKPPVLYEATPLGGLDRGGRARGADDDIWAAWFEPVLDLSRGTTYARSAISCDWERGPMWRGMGWEIHADGPLADDAPDGALACARALRDCATTCATRRRAPQSRAARGAAAAVRVRHRRPPRAASLGFAACAGLLAVAVLPQLARRRQRRRGYVTIQSPGLPKDLNLVAAAS